MLRDFTSLVTHSLAFRIARALAGFVLGVLAVSQVPVYNDVCLETGWLTLDFRCAPWPEALRGFFFVGFVAALSPSRWRLPIVAFVIVLAVSILGGLESLRVGDVLPHASWTDALLRGYPISIGGIVALTLWVFAIRKSGLPINSRSDA